MSNSSWTAPSQTFPLTSTVTAVNLECGTRPERRNSERELLTFVQSHDGRKGPGQPQENKLYLQQKRTLSLCFSYCIYLHQANIKANPTHEHGNIQQGVTSFETHLKKNNSKKVRLSSTLLKHTQLVWWCWAEALQTGSVSLLDSHLGQPSSHRAARWRPASEQKITKLPIHLQVSVWKLRWLIWGKHEYWLCIFRLMRLVEAHLYFFLYKKILSISQYSDTNITGNRYYVKLLSIIKYNGSVHNGYSLDLNLIQLFLGLKKI